MNAEPTLICPKCKAEIKLTESLAAPRVAKLLFRNPTQMMISNGGNA